MGEIKSAWEKAMEKADSLGKLSPDEADRLKYVPLGNALAAQYLREKAYDLEAELTKYKDSSAMRYVTEGAEEILLGNIFLPRSEQSKQDVKKAMTGIKLIKKDKRRVEVIFDQINNLLNYYEQARQQAFVQLKSNFAAKLQQAAAALEQQAGTRVSIDPERQPQFQEAWLKISSQLDDQYEKVLQEHKQQISKIG
jgi:exonuclease III